MIFRLIADAVFEANDVDDALKKVGMHFISLVVDDPEHHMLVLAGNIEINPYVPNGSFPYIDEQEEGKAK